MCARGRGASGERPARGRGGGGRGGRWCGGGRHRGGRRGGRGRGGGRWDGCWSEALPREGPVIFCPLPPTRPHAPVRRRNRQAPCLPVSWADRRCRAGAFPLRDCSCPQAARRGREDWQGGERGFAGQASDGMGRVAATAHAAYRRGGGAWLREGGTVRPQVCVRVRRGAPGGVYVVPGPRFLPGRGLKGDRLFISTTHPRGEARGAEGTRGLEDGSTNSGGGVRGCKRRKCRHHGRDCRR